MTHTQAVQALQILYSQIPPIACQGLCTDCCGPMGMSHLEYVRVQRATPRKLFAQRQPCPLLRQGRCTVYAVRPLICRLWGVAENMPCPWGCRPTRYLSIDEADVLMRQVEALSQVLFPGHGPKTMHPPEIIEQVQEQGATAVAWAVLATARGILEEPV